MSLTSCRLTCPGDVGLDILEVLEVMGLDVLERRACEGLFRISGAGVAINVWLVKWVLKAWDRGTGLCEVPKAREGISHGVDDRGLGAYEELT